MEPNFKNISQQWLTNHIGEGRHVHTFTCKPINLLCCCLISVLDLKNVKICFFFFFISFNGFLHLHPFACLGVYPSGRAVSIKK